MICPRIGELQDQESPQALCQLRVELKVTFYGREGQAGVIEEPNDRHKRVN